MLIPRCTKIGVIKYFGMKGYLSLMEMFEIVGRESDKGGEVGCNGSRDS